MNAKKSGLADSPFFRPAALPTPPPPAEPTQLDTEQGAPQSVPVFSNAQSHERTETQMHNRVDAHSHDSTVVRAHNNTPAQSHKRTPTLVNSSTDAQLHDNLAIQPPRPRLRVTYDVYEDQALAIQELQLKWGRERHKHLTTGQVMRELLDEILPTKK